MNVVVLKLQVTEAILTEAVLAKTAPGSPWAKLKRPR